ncbi:MAG: hypothetical protein GY697_01195 [Desulfobacterales bacterium]|nr:hypothetical protein [Desulfobacterales bacterium]
MTENPNVFDKLKDQIKQLKSTAEILGETGKEVPAVARNMVRIMASVKMLELNIVDALEIKENDMKT